MIRKLFLALPLFSATIVMAAPLTPEEALNRVLNDGLVNGTRGFNHADPIMTKITKAGIPSLYVFQENDQPGFMVVSADDITTPLLGYSDWNSLDVNNLPPALEYWLDQYSAQIDYMRENPSLFASDGQTGVKLPDWAPIQPLVKTTWNQSAPYYNLCPVYNGANCNTGCVATSMSQVMKYFNYPAKGQGEVKYTCSSINRVLTLDLSTLTFDWNNMLNSYSKGNYTDAQAEAVATLMMAAGYATEMQYSTGTSGTQSGKILSALVNNFNYDLGMRYLKRENFTYTEWATLIYNNLQSTGPVIYDGTSFNPDGTSSIGHSFVCDGYQGDGYFHFNWGWGGSSDGYFLLDALNPPALGIGGGSGGFNYAQDIIWGIQPAKSGTNPTAQKEVVIYGNVQGLTTSNQLRIGLEGPSPCGWAFIGYEKIVVDLGASFVPVNNPNATPIYVASSNVTYNINMDLEPGEYMPPTTNGVNLRPTFPFKDLATQLQKNVKYKVTNVYKNVEGGNWTEVGVDVGSYNYFYLTVTGDGTAQADYQIESFQPMQFTCSNLSLDSDLYNGIAVEVSATIVNNNDTELTRGLCLALLDDKENIRFLGGCTQLSLAAGETYSTEWVSTLYNQTNSSVTSSTVFYPGLYDPTTNTVYYLSDQPVTMQPNPGTPSYSVKLEIDNAEKVNRVYQVKDAANFDVTTTITVTRNIFSVPTQLWVAYQSGGYYYPILTYPYQQIIVSKGETATIQTNINFPTAEVGSEYVLVYYDVNTKTAKAAEKFVALGDSGVDELNVDKADIYFYHDKGSKSLYAFGDVTNIEVYALNGMKLSSEVSRSGDRVAIDLSSLGKGIVIVKATDSKGKVLSQKLAL
ncbi:MAG: C10 family peptidase [Muribaculaceae bacterium]|nr:C10 family peptidase [Muribaculaceae bacterium]